MASMGCDRRQVLLVMAAARKGDDPGAAHIVGCWV